MEQLQKLVPHEPPSLLDQQPYMVSETVTTQQARPLAKHFVVMDGAFSKDFCCLLELPLGTKVFRLHLQFLRADRALSHTVFKNTQDT